MWRWITSSRTNKVIAEVLAVLLVLALASFAGAWHFRGQMQAAKKAEKVQQERADTLVKEGEVREEVFRKALGATEVPLKNALAGVREAKTSLAQVEAARRDRWAPPAVENGDLVARFEQALKGIK